MSNKVGFIGGGQMACALASGAILQGVLRQDQLCIAEPFPAQREKLAKTFPEASLVNDGAACLESCDQIILAVKPQVLTSIGPTLARHVESRHLLVSIAAGIQLPNLESMFGTKRLVRVMPNTPCQVGAGASAISIGSAATVDDVAWVQQFIGAVGSVVQVPDSLMHAVTGLSGSGPAYVYLFIEALADGGVSQGLPRELALKLAAHTVLGAAKMIIETGLHPGILKDQVTSPGGTTIHGLRALEQSAVRGSVMDAVAKATERSRQLGS